MGLGANDFTAEELAELFGSEIKQETPPAKEKETVPPEGQPGAEPNKSEGVDTTKAFAKRLKESTDKARQEERDNIC